MAIQTIGSGRDYATFADWRTFLGTIDEPYTRDDIGELYDGLTVTSVQTFDRPAWTTGSGTVELKGASSSRHAGVIDTSKAGLYRTDDSTADVTFLLAPFATTGAMTMILRALGISRISATGAGNALQIRSDVDGGPHTIRISECVVFLSTSSTSGGTGGIDTNNASLSQTTLILDNCTIISNAYGGVLTIDQQLLGLRIYNCTFLSTASAGTSPRGLYVSTAPSGGTYEVKNCYSATTTGYASFRPFELAGSPTFTHNASGGGNASYQATSVTGNANCWDTVPAADYYDLTNLSTGGAIRKTYSGGGSNRLDDTGTVLGSTYATDVLGAVRSGTWSIGSQEFINNQPPVLSALVGEKSISGSWVAATSGETVIGGTQMRFSATASDAEDGNITSSIAWEADTGSGFASIGTGASVTWTSPTGAGTHTIRATITDSGTQSDSDTLTVVTATLLANAGPDQTVAAWDPAVQLNGSLSATASGTLTYAWTQVSGVGVTVSLSGANTATPTFAAPYVSWGRVTRANSTAYRAGVVFDSGSRAMLVLNSGTSGASPPAGYDTTTTGDTLTDGTLTLRDIGADTSYNSAAQYTMPLQFTLEVGNGTDTQTDTVTVNVNFCQQTVVYAARRWADRAWDRRTQLFLTDGTQLDLYANGRDGKDWVAPSVTVPDRYIAAGITAPQGEWYVEDGGVSYLPMADFGNPIVAPGMMSAFAKIYQLTGWVTAKDRAVNVARSVLRVFNEFQFWQDVTTYRSVAEAAGIACMPGEAGTLYGSNQGNNWPWYFASLTGNWNADEGAVGAAILGLVYTADILRTAGDSEWLQIFDTGFGYGDQDSVRKIWAWYQNEADREYGDPGGSLGSRKPYATGGFAEITPLDRAAIVGANDNLDVRWGFYMGSKMIQDKAHACMLLALGRTATLATAASSSWLSSIRAFLTLQMDWTLDRLLAYKASNLLPPCGQYSEGPTIYNPTKQWALDEPCAARAQDYPGALVAETAILQGLVYLWRQGHIDYDATNKDRIIKFGGAVPTGWLQDYMDNIRLIGAPAADAAISPLPYRTSPSNQWYRGYCYPTLDPNYAAATAALIAARSDPTATAQIVFCSAIDSATYGDAKFGYDVIDGDTTVDTFDPDFNIGFLESGTASGGGGQTEYFGSGNSDVGERSLLVNAGTGYVLEDGGTGGGMSGYRSGVRENVWCLLPSSSDPNPNSVLNITYDHTYGSFYSGTLGDYYDVGLNITNMCAVLNAWSTIQNTPAVYDSDGDGTPDSSPNPPETPTTRVRKAGTHRSRAGIEKIKETIGAMFRFKSSP
jgi:hypothetical protein